MNLKLVLAIKASPFRTQVRTAQAIEGITEHRLSRIINGWTKPTADEQQRIADALDVDVEEIFPTGSMRPTAPEPDGAAA
jgi:hypothetical protein